MPQYSFGTGSLWGVNTASNSTPVRFGGLQNISIDFAFTTKELYSSYQFPVAIGRGTAKISGKASFAQFNALILNDLFFNEGSAPSSGQILTAINENHSVPGTSTYTITVTHAVDFLTDLGVTYAATGLPLTKVASLTAIGQYSVNVSTGVYTFYSADASASVNISYNYASTGGKTISMTNQLLGQAAFFTASFSEIYNSQTLTWTLNRCMSDKLSLPFKLEDFTMADFEFSAFADSSGSLGTITMAE